MELLKINNQKDQEQFRKITVVSTWRNSQIHWQSPQGKIKTEMRYTSHPLGWQNWKARSCQMLGRPWGTRNHYYGNTAVLASNLAVQNETGHTCTLGPSRLPLDARDPHWDTHTKMFITALLIFGRSQSRPEPITRGLDQANGVDTY